MAKLKGAFLQLVLRTCQRRQLRNRPTCSPYLIFKMLLIGRQTTQAWLILYFVNLILFINSLRLEYLDTTCYKRKSR
jgi:hypothetical protein